MLWLDFSGMEHICKGFPKAGVTFWTPPLAPPTLSNYHVMWSRLGGLMDARNLMTLCISNGTMRTCVLISQQC